MRTSAFSAESAEEHTSTLSIANIIDRIKVSGPGPYSAPGFALTKISTPHAEIRK